MLKSVQRVRLLACGRAPALIVCTLGIAEDLSAPVVVLMGVIALQSMLKGRIRREARIGVITAGGHNRHSDSAVGMFIVMRRAGRRRSSCQRGDVSRLLLSFCISLYSRLGRCQSEDRPAIAGGTPKRKVPVPGEWLSRFRAAILRGRS